MRRYPCREAREEAWQRGNEPRSRRASARASPGSRARSETRSPAAMRTPATGGRPFRAPRRCRPEL